ncbi:hypothetical protein JCM3775_006990 [Rhodotorula graminis]|uniref:RRM domain-containing protein n=1 Tax=Rhodotorula graminis (strain WP1) TaxID=578459 RepID=A0A0P9EI72_RHOGW|nr:uncharacterized protein RHOBADRAFT_55219 [Rhodotorula graminis WP1]KPV72970.1 hypothetical protein RHOBADRAFT_55219 [Rhodotorula graminis WP1]
MAPGNKKKGVKMDLNSFLGDSATGGSWADEVDELPTGPSAGPTFGGDDGRLGGSHLTRNMAGGPRDGGFGGGPRGGPGGFESDRPMRAEVPIPTEPPYTAFVGNLSFETREGDLEAFFEGLGVKSVRLVDGQDGKPRGFGYVEFATVDDLKNALTATGADLQGRAIRVGVAEAREARFGRADEASTWERTGPLPSLGGRSGGFGAPRTGGGFGAGADDVEREGPIRGGKFQPSAPMPDRRGGAGGPGFSSYERAGGRPPMQDEVERDGPIRGGKFAPSEPSPRRMFSDREPSRADEQSWERRGPLAGGAPQERRGPYGAPGADAPTRRPLQLSARSAAPSTPSTSTESSAPTSSRASPFGAARPVDVSTREREVEAKLAAAPSAARPAAPEKRDSRDKKGAEGGAAAAAEASRADGAWTRKGPLAPAAAKPKEVAPPVGGGAVEGAKKPAKKDDKFSFAKAADVDEVTEGVSEL